jgi:hypothetical protein
MSDLLRGADYSAGREAGVQEDILDEDRSATSPAADRANPDDDDALAGVPD